MNPRDLIKLRLKTTGLGVYLQLFFAMLFVFNLSEFWQFVFN